MSEKPRDIISDAAVKRVHANANFGAMTKRQVLADGVVKAAFGYSGGHTQLCILEEHGLVRKHRPRSYYPSLTKKGQRYLRAEIGDNFSAFVELTKAYEELS